MASKKQIHSIHIEPADNGFMATTRYKSTSKDKYDYGMGGDEEKTVHGSAEECAEYCSGKMKEHGGTMKDTSGSSKTQRSTPAKKGTASSTAAKVVMAAKTKKK